MNPNKKLIIRDGIFATYNENGYKRPIIICNVKRDSTGTYFNARDRRSNQLLKKRNSPIMWSAYYAIKIGQIEIENPEYEEDIETNEVTIEFDVLKDKRDELSKFYLNNVDFNNSSFVLDDEQLNAVLSEQNTLITARAGSGKTRVLIAKLLYLFEKQGLNENNVLAFCFNHDANIEISDRLNTKCKINNELKYENYDIAKTFHSFSKNSFRQNGKILTDRTKLIKLIINELRHNDIKFSRNVYNFFRRETLRIDRKNFYNLESYYKYVRNCEYITLNNEKVKSKSEKFIADFLFEHGVDYVYERSYYPYKISFKNSSLSTEEIKRCINFIEEKKEIIPDFYLPKHKTIWEHWGVIGNESKEEIEHFEKTVGNYKDYLANREWKQKFWSKYWRTSLSNDNKYNRDIKSINNFIETNHQQLNFETREEVEKELYKILTKYGIELKKLPDDVLFEKVWEKSIDSFTILIDQFINKLQQNYFDNIDVFVEKAKNIDDEKTKIYYRLGYQIYKKYVEILNSNNNSNAFSIYNDYSYDFNQLIYECSKRIQNGDLDNKLVELKWILIDEYQDFSRLFDYLINSILGRNKNIKLFCVGDDWQAINRFAGSDLKYFQTFLTRYNNSQLLNIRTNYRSENHIVQFANRFMDKCGMFGERPRSHIMSKGLSNEVDITDLYIGKFDDDNIYLKFLQENEHNKIEKAKYLKFCADIIKENQNKKIMVLSRGNLILGKEIDEFNIVLKKICSEFMNIEDYNHNVMVKTVHKSKGEEADIVIVLNVNAGVFPVFNSNNDLFEIFGHSTIDSIEDEERLYYVALTRAKQSLYVLYENKTKSSFIMSK